ncbi:hypothetical protein B0H14DRAFT_3424700 [Mycena olivaceomarginata]|nr:hypothetical protein B0H14DRAFT_3434457 [Mycena olivaceomarginata]KAJ7898325.1 hypothetical protein B0H14DRAFT_3424700 [Mycena olivaceomarginata]
MMNLLWAPDFKPALDADGNRVPPDIWAYDKGAAMRPQYFECRISPRAREKVNIIEKEFFEAAGIFAKFEMGLSAEEKVFVPKSRV